MTIYDNRSSHKLIVNIFCKSVTILMQGKNLVYSLMAVTFDLETRKIVRIAV